MELVKLLAERRLGAVAVLLIAGALGVQIGDEQQKLITLAVTGFGSAMFLWSRFVKIERAELYRRVIASVPAVLYAFMGVVLGDAAPDAERAQFVQGVLAVISLALGGWSFKTENTVRPARNP